MTYQILPSLLASDWMHFGDEIEAVMQAGANMIHLDVMDNHYVPNLTFGPPLCQAIRKRFPEVPIDVHIMATPVDDLIQTLAQAGATRISIHPDATIHLDRSLEHIRTHGCLAGLVLNPATADTWLTWCVHRLDFVLVMTVNPGFGGQSLIPEVIPKIKNIRQTHPSLPICVDGGIAVENIHSLAAAGATEFVIGSSLFHNKPYPSTIQQFRTALRASRG